MIIICANDRFLRLRTTEFDGNFQTFRITQSEEKLPRRKKIPDYKFPHCHDKYLSKSGIQNHIAKVHSNPDPSIVQFIFHSMFSETIPFDT